MFSELKELTNTKHLEWYLAGWDHPHGHCSDEHLGAFSECRTAPGPCQVTCVGISLQLIERILASSSHWGPKGAFYTISGFLKFVYHHHHHHRYYYLF